MALESSCCLFYVRFTPPEKYLKKLFIDQSTKPSLSWDFRPLFPALLLLWYYKSLVHKKTKPFVLSPPLSLKATLPPGSFGSCPLIYHDVPLQPQIGSFFTRPAPKNSLSEEHKSHAHMCCPNSRNRSFSLIRDQNPPSSYLFPASSIAQKSRKKIHPMSPWNIPMSPLFCTLPVLPQAPVFASHNLSKSLSLFVLSPLLPTRIHLSKIGCLDLFPSNLFL